MYTTSLLYTMSQESVISTRFPSREARQIEKFAKEEDIDKSALIKRLLHKSLEEYKIERAFRLYQEGVLTLGEAAVQAGKSVWEMIDLMKRYSIYLTYTKEDLEEDMQTLKELQ